MTRAAGAGRPMDAATTSRILDVTLQMLIEHGYSALRIERIAAAAGCAKTTLYRRWSTRAELVVDALLPFLDHGSDPDTGNIVDDLVAFTLQNNRNQTQRDLDPQTGRAWAVLVEPEVREILWSGYLTSRRDMGREMIRRAIRRGELPADTDEETVMDVLAGFTFFRNAVRGSAAPDRTHRAIVQALVASPPRTTP